MRPGEPMENWMKIMTRVATELDSLGVEYQLSGGAAARFYGSPRPVNDLDFELEDKDLRRATDLLVAKGARLVQEVGPYEDSSWQVNLSILEWDGQTIELVGCKEARIWDQAGSEWRNFANNPRKAQWRRFGGSLIRIISLHDLISYKSILRRPVDLEDLEELTGRAQGAARRSWVESLEMTPRPLWVEEVVSRL